MKSRLHFTDMEKPNTHTIFVEDDDEGVKNYNYLMQF